MRRILLALVLLLVAGPAWANSCPSYTYTLTNGQTADATQVMSNFNTIMNCASFFVGGTTTGTPAAQVLATVTPNSPFTLTSGNRVTFVTGFSATGPTTLNVAGTGATNVFKKAASGLVALASNDMVANQIYTVQYDGTQYELLDPVATAALTPSTITGLQAESGVDGTGNTQVVYNLSEAVAKTALGGTAYLGSNLSLKFNCSSSGAGGMDTGSCPITGTLNIYLITNGTGTWNTLGWSGQTAATVTATVSGGTVTGTSGLVGGKGYAKPPRVYASSIAGCTKLPQFHATVSGGAVASVVVDGNGGASCTSVTITISPPDCEIYAGANMPSGYTAVALLGSYPMQAGPTFNFPASGPVSSPTVSGYFWQKDRSVYFAKQNVLNITTSIPITWTSASIASYVPLNAKQISGVLGQPTASKSSLAYLSSDIQGTSEIVSSVGTTGTVTDGFDSASSFSQMPLSNSQTIYYKSGSTANAIRADLTSYTF